MAEQTQEKAQEQNQEQEVSKRQQEIESQLEKARQEGGEPGSPVGDTGYFFNMADTENTTNIPRRKGSKFLPGHDAKMYKLNRQYLEGNVEINEYQRAYMEERGMPLDRKAYQQEQEAKNKAKEAKKQRAQKEREAAKAEKENKKEAAKQAREAAREKAKEQEDAEA